LHYLSINILFYHVAQPVFSETETGSFAHVESLTRPKNRHEGLHPALVRY
jgi:hypothetical protein